MWKRLRSVVLESAAAQAVDSYSGDHDRFDEAWQALEWLLSRDPDMGFTTSHDGEVFHLYVQAGDELAETPDIWVVYSYTDNEVTVYGVEAKAADTKASDSA